MICSESDYRYLYEVELCNCIELYTKSIIQLNSNTFFYKGMNFQFAIERHLYFCYINSELLFNTFIASKENNRNYKAEASNEIDYFFIKAFLKNNVDLFKKVNCKNETKSKNLKSYISHIYHNFFFNIKLQLNIIFSRRKQPSLNNGIILNIFHPKFYYYLKNVLDVLRNEHKVIITANFSKPNDIDETYWYNTEIHFNKVKLRNFIKVTTYLETHFFWMIEYVEMMLFTFKKSKPSLLLVVEGNSPFDELTNQVGKKISIPVVCFQQGWSPIVHVGFRNFSFFKMFIWGQEFSKLFRPYNQTQDFVSVGTHVLNRPITLFKSKPNNIIFFLQAVTKIITQEIWDSLIDTITWTSNKFPQSKIFVREHPSSPLNEFDKEKLNAENIIFKNGNSNPLDQIFENVIVSVSIFSSTILESVCKSTLPIIFNPLKVATYNPDIVSLNAAIEVNNSSKLKDIIENVLNKKLCLRKYEDGIENVSKLFFQFCGQEAILQSKFEIDKIVHLNQI